MLTFTKTGSYHNANKEACGDVVMTLCKDNRSLIVIADGVSSCRFGAEGATIAAEAAMDFILEHLEMDYLTPKVWGGMLLNHVLNTIMRFSAAQQQPSVEYSCTLLAVVMDREFGKLQFVNVGDGMLLGIRKESCPIIATPLFSSQGCPVITTTGVNHIAQFGSVPLKGIRGIVACSDGAWKRMYNREFLRAELRQLLIDGHYEAFLSFFDRTAGVDDCGIAIENIERVA